MIKGPQQKLQKKIITIGSIKEARDILRTLKADSIVCFDIDDTITSAGKNKHIVEAEMLKIIKDLRRRGITVIAVTARSPVMHGKERIGDFLLKKAGVNLKGSKFGDKLIKLNPVEGNKDRKPAQDITCLYENGILYTSNGNKGQALFQLLKVLKVHPSKVVLFDDRKHNLEDMYNCCKKNNMKFLGFEYLAAKPKPPVVHPAPLRRLPVAPVPPRGVRMPVPVVAGKQPAPARGPVVRPVAKPAVVAPAPKRQVPAHVVPGPKPALLHLQKMMQQKQVNMRQAAKQIKPPVNPRQKARRAL